jgi:hypothetical protein
MKPRPAGLASPVRKTILLGICCREGLWVGSGVSEVQAGFVASLERYRGCRSDAVGTISPRELKCCERVPLGLLQSGSAAGFTTDIV